MNKINLVLTVSVITAGFLHFDAPVSASPETTAKVHSALANWRTLTPEALRQPENADLLNQLREIARDKRQTAARVPLIRLGDEEVIRSSLEDLRANRPSRRSSAMNQLGFAANPAIIPLLGEDLNRQEPTDRIFFSDVWMLPLSVATAAIIKETILQSPAFSDDLKQWARRLPADSASLRAGIRAFWETNNSAFMRGDYRAVRVPRS